MTIAVLNNRGGRIFEQLPIASHAEVELSRWTTPHALSLEGAARMYGVPYQRASDREQLHEALAIAQRRKGVNIVEIELGPDSARASPPVPHQRIGAASRFAADAVT